jgi:hypothetical protein
LKNSMTEKIRLKTEQINPITEQIKLREWKRNKGNEEGIWRKD